MFKGPVAVVCQDRTVAATAFERYGFDAAALSASHINDWLRKFGCISVDTAAANQLDWLSERQYDQRTVRSSGWVTVGFLKRLPADPNVGAYAIATAYLNDRCRTPG